MKGSSVRWRPGAPIGWVSPASDSHVLIDLSSDGCRFLTKDPIKPGRRLSLSIEAPAKEAPARTTGVVAWSVRSEEHDAWQIGIAMKPASSSAAARLKHLLDGAVLDRVEIAPHHFLKVTDKA